MAQLVEIFKSNENFIIFVRFNLVIKISAVSNKCYHKTSFTINIYSQNDYDIVV